MDTGMKDDIFSLLRRESKTTALASDGLLSDTKWWIDTGSYLFNALISGSFFKGFPGNKIVAFAGPHSSGKTFLTLHILKNFLNLNPVNKILYFDTEGALATDDLKEVDIDLKRFYHTLIDSANKFKSTIYKVLDFIEKNKLNEYFIVLDSLGRMSMKSDKENTLKDKDTVDMGRRAQYITEIFRTITPQLSALHQPFLVTSHTYDSMSLYSTKKISGGSGLENAANTIVELSPAKIKFENEIVGTSVTAKARKARATVQWKMIDIAIYFKTGLSRYYGLIDFGIQFNYFQKVGNKIKLPDGRLLFKKEIDENRKEIFNEKTLKELDEFAKEYFTYGKSVNEDVL